VINAGNDKDEAESWRLSVEHVYRKEPAEVRKGRTNSVIIAYVLFASHKIICRQRVIKDGDALKVLADVREEPHKLKEQLNEDLIE
jgi:hypothetical protein